MHCVAVLGSSGKRQTSSAVKATPASVRPLRTLEMSLSADTLSVTRFCAAACSALAASSADMVGAAGAGMEGGDPGTVLAAPASGGAPPPRRPPSLSEMAAVAAPS